MIKDPAVRQSIAKQWATIGRLCESSHRQSQIPGGPFINETPAGPEDGRLQVASSLGGL